MFSCYFLRIIRQSIQVLCPVCSCKVFFRGVEGSNKVWTSKTLLSVSRHDFVKHGSRVISAAKQLEILPVLLVATDDLLSESPHSIFGITSLSVSHQDFVEHGGRVISAAKQPEILHVPLVATNDLLSELPNSIFATSFFFRETMNFLRRTNKLAFTGNMNSLLKGTKLAFSGHINSLWRTKLAFLCNIKSVRGNRLAFSGNMNFLMGIDTVLRGIIGSELKTNATVRSIIMVNTDNGFFDCHAKHAEQNRLLDTDINLSTVLFE